MKLIRLIPLAIPVIGCFAAAVDLCGSQPRSTKTPGGPAKKTQVDAAADVVEQFNQAQTEKPIPLNKQHTVLLDRSGKKLLLRAKVVLRDGILEMLCCPKQTKEHESVLAVDAKAFIIHAGLLALGAKPGQPVRYYPDYHPATGQRVDVFLQWRDKKGNPHRVPAQRWLRHSIFRYHVVEMKVLPKGLKISRETELRFDERNHELTWFGPMSKKQRDSLLSLHSDKQYQKAINSFYDQSQPRQMRAQWVFAGSVFDEDEKTGEKHYRAEVGDLICVANFSSAMLDLSIESSAGNDGRLFEAYTERIPPLDTEVTIELIPVFQSMTTKSDSPSKRIVNKKK